MSTCPFVRSTDLNKWQPLSAKARIPADKTVLNPRSQAKNQQMRETQKSTSMYTVHQYFFSLFLLISNQSFSRQSMVTLLIYHHQHNKLKIKRTPIFYLVSVAGSYLYIDMRCACCTYYGRCGEYPSLKAPLTACTVILIYAYMQCCYLCTIVLYETITKASLCNLIPTRIVTFLPQLSWQYKRLLCSVLD